MNARKHREIEQATRDGSRLGPKGKQSGSGSSLWPDANTCTAGVQSEPKSLRVMVAEHGKAANPVPVRNWADLTARRVRRSSIGRTEEANASGNALDKPTSVWSEMARNIVEPPRAEKANDGQRTLTDASRRYCPKEQSDQRPQPTYCQAGRDDRTAGRPRWGWPYPGLSRMKGNFQVRFLEGGGLATARLYSAAHLFSQPAS
jgi:hypothetical protein